MKAASLSTLFAIAVASLLVACSTPQSPKPVDSKADAPDAASATETRDDEGASLPDEKYVGELEEVARFDEMMLTGVTVSNEGRIFVNFPRWGDDVPFTVAEVVEGVARPYPNQAVNELDAPYAEHFVSVQSVVVAPDNHLWVLDTGRPEFKPPVEDGQKLVKIDLETDKIVDTILLPSDVALPSTYLNDIRFDLSRGEKGMAFITDSSSSGGIIVVDLDTEESWRRLSDHPSTGAENDFLPFVEGQPLMTRPAGKPASHMAIGSDGIAMDQEGERLIYRPLSGRGLFSVSMDALVDRQMDDAQVAKTVENHGQLGFASDGLVHDAAGNLYLTNYEDNAVVRRNSEGELETIVHDPRALWPDTMAIGPDGYLYFTANQLHRQPNFHNGEDLREKPYVLFRVEIGEAPVLLK